MGTVAVDEWDVTFGTARMVRVGHSPPRPLLAVQNVTAHPSTASVTITVLLYNGPLLCGCNVPVFMSCYPALGVRVLINYNNNNNNNNNNFLHNNNNNNNNNNGFV